MCKIQLGGMKNIRPLLILFISLYLVPLCLAQTLPVALQERIERDLRDPSLKSASVALYVRSLDRDITVYEKNADLALMPASNQKLYTGAIALQTLGSDFCYKTTILMDKSPIDNGTYNGNLYIKGSGDPSFDSTRLLALAKQIKAAGINRINGSILGDGSAFTGDALGVGWQWDDEPFYYSAQVSGLNCDENVVSIQTFPTKVGESVRYRIGGEKARELGFSTSDFFRIQNNAITIADKGKRPEMARLRGANTITIDGIQSMDYPVASEAITIENPALFTASRFADLLAIAGVQVLSKNWMHPLLGKVPMDAIPIATDTSEPLSTLMTQFFKSSDNLYGECLLRTVGGGDSAKGESNLYTFLNQNGGDTSGVQTVDGSGLSRMDSITARLTVQLLTAMNNSTNKRIKSVYFDALPIAGVDGTLRNRFKATFLQNNLHAKTGTLSGVTTLSGYFTTKAGEHLVFSFLINQHAPGKGAAARLAMDDALLAIADLPR